MVLQIMKSLKEWNIIKRLIEKNIILQSTSSDGDKHFNDDHEKAFKEYERMMEEGASFKDLVSVVGGMIQNHFI